MNEILKIDFEENLPAPEFDGQRLIIGGVLYLIAEGDSWTVSVPPLPDVDFVNLRFLTKPSFIYGEISPFLAIPRINLKLPIFDPSKHTLLEGNSFEEEKERYLKNRREIDKDKKVVKLSDYRF